MAVDIRWMDRRGAGRGETTTVEATLRKRLETNYRQHLDTTVRVANTDDVVGGVEQTPDGWTWWYDPDYVA